MNAWPRGSEWRKWDLHVHAPGTKLNDQFKAAGGDVWQEYCQCLEDSDVTAFGITDYFSADTYFRASQEMKDRFPDSQKVLFPNMELRTSYVVNKAQEEVHLHLIFNPSAPGHRTDIERFLANLKTTKTDKTSRAVRASELRKAAHVAAATTSLEFLREALDETFGKDADLLDHVLVFCSANNDGIRAESGKARKLQIADEVDKFSNAFFGNVGNVDYFLRGDRAEDNEPTKPKAVVSGSDAHSFAELRERSGQVVSDSNKGIVFLPTWIKADLTFEGLKQIVFEPRNRSYIGREPEVERRTRENRTWYIESLHITAVDGYDGRHGTWFDDECIPLGKELVAIIGNKGSGKSAVTDIIGLLGNSHNQSAAPTGGERLFSFLNKDKFLKGGYAANFRGTLNWYDGPPDEGLLSDETQPFLPEKVEYLPQRYLERICANIADDEFRRTLNGVIFGYVPESERYGKQNLDDLISYLTREAEQEIALKKHALHHANEEVVAIERKLTEDHRRRLEELHKLKSDELAAHLRAKPVEVPSPPDAQEAAESREIADLTTRIAQLADRIKDREAELVKVSQTSEEIRQLRQAFQSRVNAVTELREEWQATLEAIGVPFEDVVRLELDLRPLDGALSAQDKKLLELQELLSPEETVEQQDGGQATPPRSLILQRQNLQATQSALVERLSKPQREHEEYLESLRSWEARQRLLRGDPNEPDPDSLLGLERELERIVTGYPIALQAVRERRSERSKEILEHRRALTSLYNNIKRSIDSEIMKAREDLGEYDISIEAGLRFSPDFVDDFLGFINQAVLGSFRGQEEGRGLVKKLTEAVLDWEAEPNVFSFVETVVDALHRDQRPDVSPEHAARDIFKQIKGQRTVVELYDYLFSFDYLKAKYDLKVDQKDLSELSPGERGGLLLIFYLMLDRQQTPLLIDQPEDNLDNKSVYQILVKFIRHAKQRRQIILVTHNPNLAVVADAEQIVHVSIDKKDGRHDFDFFSGSIEDPRVNRAVVDILEGTLPAFDNRRIKYRRGTLESASSED